MNRILAAIPEHERQRLEPQLQLTQFAHREPLIAAGEPLRHVYFPVDLVASTVHSMTDGSSVETAMIGFDGMVGVQAFLRQTVAHTNTIVQIPGHAYRMRIEAFRRELHECPDSVFSDLIASYISAYLTMTTIGAACNRIHRVEQRLCRWLKMTHNRTVSDVFPIRHEFLAYLLGVHRPSISIAANMLQKAKLIRYGYGRMSILNSKGLETGACECYGAMEKQIERVYSKSMRK